MINWAALMSPVGFWRAVLKLIGKLSAIAILAIFDSSCLLGNLKKGKKCGDLVELYQIYLSIFTFTLVFNYHVICVRACVIMAAVHTVPLHCSCIIIPLRLECVLHSPPWLGSFHLRFNFIFRAVEWSVSLKSMLTLLT